MTFIAGISNKVIFISLIFINLIQSSRAADLGKIYNGENLIGQITSGTMSPSLGKGIGLGYVSTPFKNIGTELNIEIRGRKKNAIVVKAPFYTKGSLLA